LTAVGGNASDKENVMCLPVGPKSTGKRSCGIVANQNAVTKYFEEQAESYSTLFDADRRSGAAVLFKLRRRLVIELLSGENPRSLIDIATGSGEISCAAAASFKFDHLLLNDISPKMLQLAYSCFQRWRPPGDITWVNQDGFELLTNLGPDRFDVVLAIGLIAHTGRLSELLARAFACLRRGGVLILQSSVTDHPGAFVTALYARSPFRRVPYRVTTFSKNEIIAGAIRAGFEVVETRRYGVCLPFGDRILGRINHRLEEAYAETLTRTGGEALFKLRKTA
jgi:ubiquinone/menaquinone biosynthesis C-methylase UbiE